MAAARFEMFQVRCSTVDDVNPASLNMNHATIGPGVFVSKTMQHFYHQQ